MSQHYWERVTEVIVADRLGAEIARCAKPRGDVEDFEKSLGHNSSLVCLPASLFGGKFDRYIPLDRIGEIQIQRR